MYPEREGGERPWNRCALFNSLGRNKLSMTVDLTDAKGKGIFKDLVRESDIVVENNSAGTMDKLGLGYEALREVRQDIIMISMPAFGNYGPYSTYKGFAPIVEALIGHTWLRGFPHSDPTQTGVPDYRCDAAGGASCAFAALIALYHRYQTGEGQFIDMSLAEAMLPHLGEFVIDYTMNQRVQEPIGNRSQFGIQGCYQCKGRDKWINITIDSDEKWQKFCQVLGNPPWADYERFSNMLTRYQNHDELDVLIGGWCKEHEPYEIMHLMQEAEIPCGPVLYEEDTFGDPHLKARGYYLRMSHPEAGTHLYPGFLWEMSETSPGTRPPPCLGEHNGYVYEEVLGRTPDDIVQLEQEGHIGTDYLTA